MSARPAHAQFGSPAQATAQYREGLFLKRYPLLEVYVANPTGEPITFRHGFLNGEQVRAMSNGVVWAQWYPSEKVAPGQTILYPVCLEEHPKTDQYLELETDVGPFVKAELLPFRPPSSRITAVTFPLDSRRVFVFFECPQTGDALAGVGAVVVNPYRLGYSGSERFIEAEEESFGWARMASQPRPIGWLPETFTFPWKNRMLEPAELRLLSYAALGSGVKIIWYYTLESRAASKGVSAIHGMEKSGPLLAEVGRVNRDVKRMEGIFSAAVPISSETVGDAEHGLRVQTLWAGDEGMVVVVRNLDYQTDRQANDLGARPRCKVVAKDKVRITVRKPAWLAIRDVRDGLTGQPVKWAMNTEGIELDLGRLELGRVIFLQNQ